MKKNFICIILSTLLFRPAVPVYAEITNFFNESQITLGSASDLNQAVQNAIDEMGLEYVNNVLIATGNSESNMHDLIIISDSYGKFLAHCFYNQNTDSWSCSRISNVDNKSIVYWADESTSPNYTYELVDYKTGSFIITDMCQEILDDYIERDNWPLIEDMYLYNSEGLQIELPDSDSNIDSIAGTDEYPDAHTYRNIKIGDYAVAALSDFDPICYKFWIYANDSSDESKALVNEYQTQLEAMDSSEYLSFLTNVDYSRIKLVVGLDMAEIDGYLIPTSDDRVQKVFHRYNRSLEFSIENGIIKKIYVGATRRLDI